VRGALLPNILNPIFILHLCNWLIYNNIFAPKIQWVGNDTYLSVVKLYFMPYCLIIPLYSYWAFETLADTVEIPTLIREGVN
jgi:hypothetical protein